MIARVSKVGIIGKARDALATLPKTGESGFEELAQQPSVRPFWDQSACRLALNRENAAVSVLVCS